MKKFLLMLVAMCSMGNAMAQEEWSEEQWKRDMAPETKSNATAKKAEPSVATASADKQTGVIDIVVPQKLRIEDKVIVENVSAYEIVQMAVLADYNDNGQYVSLASTSSVLVGALKEILDTDEGLSSLRGKKLKIKVKGKKTNTDQVTYDFNVTLYERDHDLYIKVGSNDAFDF